MGVQGQKVPGWYHEEAQGLVLPTGDLQVEGIDYFDVYAPLVQLYHYRKEVPGQIFMMRVNRYEILEVRADLFSVFVFV